ncbi:uncharacterized protein N7446_006442 [Penicillium canescens]|uniref:Uncharacterized protein n=1 Tax=Penicillium canescens TaxID=5083 RepID=A0AAD6NCM8_PENCN|nr:uncharacterized protein N7446_006442 [Penicillium canescens]KAJ6051806.1 hypothetical protein N7460_002340 [Penicillium canescens]KAJ6062322.1 hypothetical protein N7446_006442 [Penicillium canescens]KAJ6182653.1 hypothetical protein N7485_001295 [Penicillium canescens]
MMSSNAKSHRIRNKKKYLEIISLASTTTQDTDNSQPAASMMAPSNEPLSQRIESAALSPSATAFTPASALGKITESTNAEGDPVSATSSTSAIPDAPVKSTEYIDLDTPVSSPAASHGDADADADTCSNVANAGSPVASVRAKAAGAGPTAADARSTAPDGSNANDEPTHPGPAHSCAEKQAVTIIAIDAFVQMRLLRGDVIEVLLAPLRVPVNGTTDYKVWRSSLALVLLQHGVCSVVDGDFHPLPLGHELQLWYVHMIYTACALIWNSLSHEVKKDRHVRYYLDTKHPRKVLQLLARSFGDGHCEYHDGNVPDGLEMFGT